MEDNQKPLYKEWWIYVVLAVFVIVIYLIWPKNIGGEDTGLDTFATCLKEKGVIMYGTEWCPHCQNQKALFGKSFKNINYVDCDYNRQACMDALVEGYPTWKANGVNYPGEQSLQALAGYSGCELVYDE